MIKKLNIALAVVFGLMFALKLAVSMKKTAADGNDANAQVAADDGRSQLEPHVYYDDWPPFACEDYLSKRLGFLLDQIRAIFPNAEFIRHTDGTDDKWKYNQLASDPLAVVATLGKTAKGFEKFPVAPTPLGFFELRLVTLRSNPWRYSGPESLEKLRIVASNYAMDNDVTMGLEKKGVLKVRPDVELLRLDILKRGEADAIVECCSTDWAAIAENATDFVLEQCRHSEPIGRSDLFFRASTNDAAVAEALIRDFEAGMKRIRESGERRRICEYYGFKE